jgi:hypothetical protein
VTVYEFLDLHIPSITPAIEDELAARVSNASLFTADETDIADCALRVCGCGVMVDGFYEYLSHLKEEMRKAGL